nr:hypothetical protein [Tanacetum cinerariifolium]
MNNKKHTVDLESFREMLHICPRIPGQAFAELPFEEEILEFIWFLGHGATIRTLTDININKLYQSWRSFAAIINKCLTGKISGYDSLRLSQAQILWGLYHTRSIDYAFLIWEDFMYQVEHKNQKKSNEMYYPRFTKVIIHHFMSKDPSIPKRNKINWHHLKNDEIRNTKAYKEYYACATGEAAPKPKASARRKMSCSDTSITPPTSTTTPATTVAVTLRLTPAAKGKQPAKAKRVPDVPSDNSEEEFSWNSSNDEDTDAQEKDEDDDEGDERGESDDGEENDAEEKDGDERDDDDDEHEIAKIDEQDDTERGEDDDEESKSDEESDSDKTREEESFDLIHRTLEDSKDDGNDKEDQGLRISEEERLNEEEEAEELYRDINKNQGRGIQATLDVEDSHVILTPVHPDGQQESSSVSSQFVTSMLNPQSDAVLTQTRNLYKAIVDAYEADKTILDSYEDTVILKRRRDDDDHEEGPFAKTDRGSKRRREGKEPESASTPLETATMSAGRSKTGFKSRQVSASADDQTIVQSSQHPEWSSQPKKPLTPNRDWNKTLPAVQGSTQTWINFSNFIMNQLRVDTLTSKLLAGPTFELRKGSCASLIELEYQLEEVYKATMDQLDWVNPEGQQYPHNLLQPLLLIPNNRGRHVIPFAHFINNNLEYLQGGASSRKYTTSVTKMKAVDYGNIKWIEDLVPRSMWRQELINYDKHSLWESLPRGGNVSSSMGSLLTENLLSMYTPRGGSLLSRISRLWNGIATSI